jgi:hypothetical protein
MAVKRGMPKVQLVDANYTEAWRNSHAALLHARMPTCSSQEKLKLTRCQKAAATAMF